MAEQRGNGTSHKTSHKRGRRHSAAIPAPSTGVGRQRILPYYLFQSELGKLRHRRVQFLSSLLEKPVSLLCSD